MRTPEEILYEYVSGASVEESGGYIEWSEVKEMMRLYAREAIDSILSRPDMIHVDEDEAVYDYDKFEDYKKYCI